jgi:hypothetical protein
VKGKQMKFDLSKYATVEERLRAFWSDELSNDARIVTINHSKDEKSFIIETRLYLSAVDQAADLPKVTGWASEANTDSFALERCETSSIGRCLANWLWTGQKKLDGTPRPSRAEMEKVARLDSWLEQAASISSIEGLRDLYAQAKANNASKQVLDGLKLYAKRFADSQTTGVGGGLPDSAVSG